MYHIYAIIFVCWLEFFSVRTVRTIFLKLQNLAFLFFFLPIRTNEHHYSSQKIPTLNFNHPAFGVLLVCSETLPVLYCGTK